MLKTETVREWEAAMKKITKIKIFSALISFIIGIQGVLFLDSDTVCAKEEKTITLKVCSWEEYIDKGDWNEAITLSNGKSIIGENSMIEDFENWYYEKYGIKVDVEYSCFGTNEDLYNQLTMGDCYDLVCPSEYMIMKLLKEDRLIPYSDDFYNKAHDENYYIKGVSPYIKNIFEENDIDGKAWSDYAACYMWGITGTVYNPDVISEEEASTMELYLNRKYKRKVTLKDNIRDSYFVALGIKNQEILLDDDFINSEKYSEKLADIMNDVEAETVSEVKELLHKMVDNAYSLETDSGKSDMVAGKVCASYQWSGDAVYALDEADKEDFYLEFAVPKECTNLWFDGWVMLKSGIDGDKEKQKAAESFVNFLSMPENAVRNMRYIGYTSAISGGDDDTVFEYVKWCYGNEDGDIEYPTGYFFSGNNEDEKYMIKTDYEQTKRQLFAQYPTLEVMERSSVMKYFDNEQNKTISQMWIDVRCFDIRETPFFVWVVLGIMVICSAAFYIKKRN